MAPRCCPPKAGAKEIASGLSLPASPPPALRTQPGLTSAEDDCSPPPDTPGHARGRAKDTTPTHTFVNFDGTVSRTEQAACQDTGGTKCSACTLLHSAATWENLFGHSHSGRSQREGVQDSTPSGYSGPALHRGAQVNPRVVLVMCAHGSLTA